MTYSHGSEGQAGATAPASRVLEHSTSLLDVAQLSERWRVPETHVYRLAREGKLRTVRLGRYRRWRLVDIEAFESEGGADVVNGDISCDTIARIYLQTRAYRVGFILRSTHREG